MALEKTLKARIAIVGGEKVVEKFDDLGRHGVLAMKAIDKEADKASREVDKLRRELEALDRISRHIRAKIKIDADTGPTAAQMAALKALDSLDADIAARRSALDAMKSALSPDFGEQTRVARTFASALDDGIDLFDADGLHARVSAALREAGEDGALFPKTEVRRIESILDKYARISARAGDNLVGNIKAIDRDFADQRAQAAVDDVLAHQERLAAKRKREEEERAAAERKALEEAEARRHKEEEERKDKVLERRYRVAERGHRRHLARLKEEREAEAENVRLAEEIFADYYRERRVMEEEAEFRRRRDSEREKADLEEFERRRQAALKRAEADFEAARRRREEERSRERATLGDIIGGDNVEVRRRTDGPAPRDGDTPDASRGLGRTGRGARRAARELDAFSRAADRAGKAVRALDGRGASIGRLFTSIGRGAAGAIADLNRFTGALTNFEHALGNVALRGGVAAIIAAIVAALAGLGGAAALGGIAAIAGLAAFDAAKLARTAESFNMALEDFTALRSAAATKGVMFDEYTQAIERSRHALVGVIKGEKEFQDAAELVQRFNIRILSDDGRDVVQFKDFLKQITALYHRLPKGAARTYLLDSFGLTALEPLIRENVSGIDRLIRRAHELGVVLDEANVEKWEEMREALWETWEIIKGIGYELANAISPDFMPILKAMNDWLIRNRMEIVNGLVRAFNWLWEAAKDFFYLFRDGSDAPTFHQWTKNVFQFGEAVVETFTTMWKAVRKAYDTIRPALQGIHNLLFRKEGEDEDPWGAFKVALAVLAGQLLGVTGLVVSFGRMIGAAFALVFNLGRRFLWPIVGWIAAIVGWPVLLAAGGTLVYAFWEDVKKWSGDAWKEFKETFPETASVLEGAFNKAKPYVDDFFSTFRKKYPNLAGVFDDIREGLSSLQERFASWDWGEIGEEGGSLLMYFIENTLRSMETLYPIMKYFVENFVGSVLTVLESLGGIYQWLKSIFTDFAGKNEDGKPRGKAAVESIDEKTGVYGWLNPFTAAAKATNRFVDWYNRNLPQALDEVPLPSGYALPAAQIPLAVTGPGNAAGTPVILNFPNSDSMTLYTDEPNVAARLNAGVKASLPRPRGR